MKFKMLLLLGFFGVQAAKAQVNYSEHIAPLIYNHCTSCHRPGEVAPFSLTNYSEVMSWGASIKYATSIKYMPPFKADPHYSDLQMVNTLSDSEIQQISDWVDGGMPQGNPALEPALPVFSTGSQVGNPDLVLHFAQQHVHVGNNVDEYRYFVLPTGLTEDKDLVALEMRPGNPSIVHHSLFWEDTTGQAAADDAATPEYGYPDPNGGTGGSIFGQLNEQLPAYVPGQRPYVYNNGIAQRLHAGSDLKLQVHYAPTSVDETDSSVVNLFFADQPATRFVKSYVMLPFGSALTNGPFVIPANQSKTFHGRWTVPEDASFLSVSPHCHLLGTHWEIYAIKPNGDTVNLVKVPEWDFNWQGGYYFRNLIYLPMGSVIHAYGGYDNTTNNPLNPNNPPQMVTWGENTADEMFYVPLHYLSYRAGDETLDLTGIENPEQTLHSIKDRLYPIAPNPSSESITVGFTLENPANVSLRVYDLYGRLVTTLAETQYYMNGMFTVGLDVSNYANGLYAFVMEARGKRQVQKFVVQH